MTKIAPSPARATRSLLIYVLPMLLFIALLGVDSVLKRPGVALWRAHPELWIYPLQTLLCAALLFYFRRTYNLQPLRQPAFTLAVALVVFALWIAPQQFLHFPPRLVGFNPEPLAAQPAWYWITIILRFLRLVVVVPLVEEIFWRGFLLRYLITEDFERVPFGTFTWLSFAVVTLAFCFPIRRRIGRRRSLPARFTTSWLIAPKASLPASWRTPLRTLRSESGSWRRSNGASGKQMASHLLLQTSECIRPFSRKSCSA